MPTFTFELSTVAGEWVIRVLRTLSCAEAFTLAGFSTRDEAILAAEGQLGSRFDSRLKVSR